MRRKQVSREQIMSLFHHGLDFAAQKIGICPSFLKQECRALGIRRWPYRKIHSLLTRMQNILFMRTKWFFRAFQTVCLNLYHEYQSRNVPQNVDDTATILDKQQIIDMVSRVIVEREPVFDTLESILCDMSRYEHLLFYASETMKKDWEQFLNVFRQVKHDSNVQDRSLVFMTRVLGNWLLDTNCDNGACHDEAMQVDSHGDAILSAPQSDEDTRATSCFTLSTLYLDQSVTNHGTVHEHLFASDETVAAETASFTVQRNQDTSCCNPTTTVTKNQDKDLVMSSVQTDQHFFYGIDLLLKAHEHVQANESMYKNHENSDETANHAHCGRRRRHHVYSTRNKKPYTRAATLRWKEKWQSQLLT